ncbi:MAG: hypothetical protein ACRDPM_24220 [Solirubrobacteraceae bacterium]
MLIQPRSERATSKRLYTSPSSNSGGEQVGRELGDLLLKVAGDQRSRACAFMAPAYAPGRVAWNTSFLEWRSLAAPGSVAVVKPGAGSPEELEALLEDAFVLRDQVAVACLFEDGGMLAWATGPRVAQGLAAIAALAERLWHAGQIYVADPRQVLQAGDMALVLGPHVTNVARREAGGWRYAIALLDDQDAYDRKAGEP